MSQEHPNVDEHVDALIGNARNLILGSGDIDLAVRGLDRAVERLVAERATIPVIKTFVIDQGDLTLAAAADPVQLTVTTTQHGKTGSQSYSDVEWASLNSAVVTVSSDGLLTVVGQGTTRVGATSVMEPKIFDEITVTVTA